MTNCVASSVGCETLRFRFHLVCSMFASGIKAPEAAVLGEFAFDNTTSHPFGLLPHRFDGDAESTNLVAKIIE